MIYKTFEQWKSGNVLEHGVPRTEYYSEDQLDLVEMGWSYGYDAGRAVEQALDKKAENARELGLDYEPADGTQVSKVWWDGEKLMAKPIPLVDFYQPMQDSTCSETLRAQGKAYPRTCRKCGLGPCIGAPKPPPTQPAPVQQESVWLCRSTKRTETGMYQAWQVCSWTEAKSHFDKKPNYEYKQFYTTPPAAAVQEGRDWSLLEATQESLREHMADIKRLKEAQPVIPDAMTSADIQEHIEYVAGWNDCRQAMMEMMK
jgi:hypothetical protein